MIMQTEQTPNPATLKFLPGRTVMERNTADFPSPETAERLPLARRLFEIEGVMGALLGADLVNVAKSGGLEWQVLKHYVPEVARIEAVD